MVTSTPVQRLQIGEVSKASQVPIKTIRYYEELGLIQAIERTTGGFRLFAPDVLLRLAFIKRAQGLGLSLHEIGDILAIHDQGNRPCHEVTQTLKAKVTEIEQRIAELTLLKQQLQGLISGADSLSHEEAGICPIIESAQGCLSTL